MATYQKKVSGNKALELLQKEISSTRNSYIMSQQLLFEKGICKLTVSPFHTASSFEFSFPKQNLIFTRVSIHCFYESIKQNEPALNFLLYIFV